MCAVPAILLACLAILPAPAADIPWAAPKYSLVARDMNLRTALDTFAMRVVTSIWLAVIAARTAPSVTSFVPAGVSATEVATS